VIGIKRITYKYFTESMPRPDDSLRCAALGCHGFVTRIFNWERFKLRSNIRALRRSLSIYFFTDLVRLFQERLWSRSYTRALEKSLVKLLSLVKDRTQTYDWTWTYEKPRRLNGAPLCARCFKDGALWRGDEIRRLERPYEVQWVGTMLRALNWQW